MIDDLLTEDQKRLRDEARDFVKNDVPRQLLLDMDADKVRYPKEYVQKVAKRGLLGLRFSKQWGGRGLTWVDEVVVLEEIGTLGCSLGCLYSLPSIIGEAIHVFGTDEQKEKYLKPTLEGKLCCAEALTEPRGGSDFFGATTTARKDGKNYILNGQKRFVVGAEGADYFLVYAKTDPSGPSHKSLSVFLVDRKHGVEVKHVYGLLGARGGGTGRIIFNDTKVPAENIIGVEGGGAMIFYQMMVPERMTSAAGALGGARAALDVAVRYSNKRKAFNKKIREFQAVSFKVAESITELDAARALTYVAARAADAGNNMDQVRRLVSETKKFTTEMSWHVVNSAMQIMGGIGYTNIYPIERGLRDARLSMIWTGTNEIMNLIIQHEYYKEVLAEIGKTRDSEADAAESELSEEKVYE